MHYTRLDSQWQDQLQHYGQHPGQHPRDEYMTFREAAPRQRVYILRFWETRSLPPDAPITWRFSAQDPQTGERRGFADLDGLMAFLAAQTGQQGGSSHRGAFPGPGLPGDLAADSEDGPRPPHQPVTAPRRRMANPWPAEETEQNAPADIAAK
jgi:hypothetical protein